LKTLAMGGGNF